ncbi:LuxR C-terminal-related transcriptional regulator [Labrys neptuniae]
MLRTDKRLRKKQAQRQSGRSRAIDQPSGNLPVADLVPDPDRQLPDLDGATTIAVICNHILLRTALARCLQGVPQMQRVDEFDSIETCFASSRLAGIIVFCAIGREEAPTLAQSLAKIAQLAPGARTIVVSDDESLPTISQALELGARGYVTLACSIDIAAAAIVLVGRGGVFVPAGLLVAAHEAQGQSRQVGKTLEKLMTRRQIDVLKLMRRGFSNRSIANQLKLSEHTVRVHVRNIMQRLQVDNRTRAVFQINEMFAGGADGGKR